MTTFATGSEDSSILLYDIRVSSKLATFKDDKYYDTINDICFSKTGRLIFAATESN